MSTFAESLSTSKKPWQWMAGGAVVLLIWAAVVMPRYNQSAPAAREAVRRSNDAIARSVPQPTATKPLAHYEESTFSKIAGAAPDAAAGRKIIRTSSLSMIVQHPAETAEKINALVEGMGGYLASSEGGGQNATVGTLTVRVPAARFEEARAAIRKLGVRIENEKIDAQDATQQYVDQDARISNLKQEEAQYLTILKRATTVKDMLAVSENLSEVRGEIEQQQAEFNALSRQIDTVAMAISLRTESVPQVAILNWDPGYQLRLALHDGLESVADYATSMTAVLFYLPAVLLWVGTIGLAGLASWKVVRWVGKRWFPSKTTTAPAQG